MPRTVTVWPLAVPVAAVNINQDVSRSRAIKRCVIYNAYHSIKYWSAVDVVPVTVIDPET